MSSKACESALCEPKTRVVPSEPRFAGPSRPCPGRAAKTARPGRAARVPVPALKVLGLRSWSPFRQTPNRFRAEANRVRLVIGLKPQPFPGHLNQPTAMANLCAIDPYLFAQEANTLFPEGFKGRKVTLPKSSVLLVQGGHQPSSHFIAVVRPAGPLAERGRQRQGRFDELVRALDKFKLSPSPATTRRVPSGSAPHSIRIPQILRPRTMTSLGHLILAGTSQPARRVSQTLTATHAVSKAGRRSDSGGNSRTDIKTLVRGGLCHERPY